MQESNGFVYNFIINTNVYIYIYFYILRCQSDEIPALPVYQHMAEVNFLGVKLFCITAGWCLIGQLIDLRLLSNQIDKDPQLQ